MQRNWFLVLILGCQNTAEPPAREGLLEGGVLSCENPLAREVYGPLFLADFGSDWTRQRGTSIEEEEYRRGDPIGFGDLNGDGALDVVLSERSEVQVYLQQSDCVLRRAYGALSAATRDVQPSAISLVDLDEDGWLDLYVGVSEEDNRFYRNLDGVEFVDETALHGLGSTDSKPRAIAWGDPDGDGDQDLFVGNDRLLSQPPDPGLDNTWLENRGDAGFVNISTGVSDEVRNGYTKNVAWLDLDSDGDQDLYVMNHMPFYSGNFLLQNDGSGGLETWEGTGLDFAMSSMGIDVADLNDDGIMDLVIAGVMEVALLLSAPGPVWVRADTALGLTLDGVDRVTAWSTNFADMDNDGRVDVLATMGPSDPGEDPGFVDPEEQSDALWLQTEEGVFDEVSLAWGMNQSVASRVAAAVDIDGNGWLDVVKSTRKGRTDIWLSRCGPEAWLRVRLRGPPGNPHGLGAEVRLEVDGRTQTRWMASGLSGYQVSAPYELHFGLGMTENIDRMEVLWPDGETDQWFDLRPRQIVDALHPEADPVEAR